MTEFQLADITELELDGSRDTLLERLARMIRASSLVQARIETLTFETGEYAVLLRGFIDTGGGSGRTGLDQEEEFEAEGDRGERAMEKRDTSPAEHTTPP